MLENLRFISPEGKKGVFLSNNYTGSGTFCIAEILNILWTSPADLPPLWIVTVNKEIISS